MDEKKREMKSLTKKQFSIVNAINTSIHASVRKMEEHYVYDCDADPRDIEDWEVNVMLGDEATMLDLYEYLKKLDKFTSSIVDFTASNGVVKPKKKSDPPEGQTTIDDFESQEPIKIEMKEQPDCEEKNEISDDVIDAVINEEATNVEAQKDEDDKLYLYCTVHINGIQKDYTFIGNENADYGLGDYVKVEMGKDNKLYIGKVVNCIFGTKSDAPFDFDKLKKIIGKAEEDEKAEEEIEMDQDSEEVNSIHDDDAFGGFDMPVDDSFDEDFENFPKKEEPIEDDLDDDPDWF